MFIKVYDVDVNNQLRYAIKLNLSVSRLPYVYDGSVCRSTSYAVASGMRRGPMAIISLVLKLQGDRAWECNMLHHFSHMRATDIVASPLGQRQEFHDPNDFL